MVLHDAHYPNYRQALKPYASQVMFTHKGAGTRALWVGSKRDLVERRLNVARHKQVWRLHDLLSGHKRSRKAKSRAQKPPTP